MNAISKDCKEGLPNQVLDIAEKAGKRISKQSVAIIDILEQSLECATFRSAAGMRDPQPRRAADERPQKRLLHGTREIIRNLKNLLKLTKILSKHWNMQ